MRIGIFTDIHFQKKGLGRIVQTGEWIVGEMSNQGVDAVVCLGDILNTREMVSVEAQSEALSFMHRLSEKWHCDVILGNHDMNLKHSRKVSSLEGLRFSSNIALHREIGITRFADGSEALMMPYHEDQVKIIETIQKLRDKVPQRLGNMVGFGHLSINGAVRETNYGTTYTGAYGTDVFEPLKRTFTGHFHVHHELNNRVLYVGSPLQFDFGDAGDARGIVIYETLDDSWYFVRNPHGERFLYITPQEIDQINPEKHDGCFVTIIYDDIVTDEEHDTNVQKLMDYGIVSVKKESVVEKAIREQAIEVDSVDSASMADLVDPFVNAVLDEKSVLSKERLSKFGKGVINLVNQRHQQVSDTGSVFVARPVALTLRNFMGFQGQYQYPLGEMRGVWLSEGRQGSGKSTLFEAIVWCLFKQNLRSGLKANDVVNDAVGGDCYVRIDYDNGYSIERWRDKGSIGVSVYRDGKKLEDYDKADPKAQQQKINELLGIDYETYLNSVVMGQNITAGFMTGDEKKRRKIIEQMLGLERIDECLIEIREMKKKLKIAGEQQSEIQRLKAEELSRYTQMIHQIEKQIIEATQARDQQISQLRESIRQRRAYVDQVDQKAASIEKGRDSALAEMDGKIRGLESEAQSIREKEHAFKEAHRIELEVSRIESIAKQIESSRITLEQARRDLAVAEAVDLDHYRDVRKQAEELREQADDIHQRSVEIRRRQESIQQKINEYAAKQQQYEQAARQKTEERCPTCNQDLSDESLKSVIDGYAGKVAATQEEMQPLIDQLSSMQSQAQNLYAQSNDLKNTVWDYQKIVEHMGLITSLRSNIEREEKIQEEQKQIIGDHDVDTLIAKKKEQIQELRSQYDADRLNFLNSEIHRLYGLRSNTVDKYQTLIHEIHEQRNEQAQAADVEEGRLGQLIQSNVDNQLEQSKKQHQQMRSQIQQDLEQSKNRAADIESQKAYIKFWDSAFSAKGAFRSFLLQDSVSDLNRILEGYISALDGELTVTFDSNLSSAESYGKRSGGQRKCTDLATLLSILELVMQRTRHRSHILCLDELFEGLDSEHLVLVNRVLSVLSQRIDLIIFITHKDISGCHIDGSLYTEMTPQGSQVYVKRI